LPPWVYTNARRGQSLDLSDLVASTEKLFVMGDEIATVGERAMRVLTKPALYQILDI
jgi:hypothetical protein